MALLGRVMLILIVYTRLYRFGISEIQKDFSFQRTLTSPLNAKNVLLTTEAGSTTECAAMCLSLACESFHVVKSSTRNTCLLLKWKNATGNASLINPAEHELISDISTYNINECFTTSQCKSDTECYAGGLCGCLSEEKEMCTSLDDEDLNHTPLQMADQCYATTNRISLVPNKYITSRNYPHPYNDNDNWNATTSSISGTDADFVVVVEDFQLEYDEYCQNDYVKFSIGMMDGSMFTCGPFCGTDFPSPLQFKCMNVTLHFHSDSNYTFKGFNISFIMKELSTQSTGQRKSKSHIP